MGGLSEENGVNFGEFTPYLGIMDGVTVLGLLENILELTKC